MRPSNPILDHIHHHASVRLYRPDPVPREWIEAIVEAGQRAATSSNLQMYSVIAVTDERRRGELSHWCGDQEHVAQAPVFLAWCADLSKLERACTLTGHTHVHEYAENYTLAVVDAALAMQNAALAAESLGLGICYIGAIRNHPREVIRLLRIPHLMFPLVGMTVGFPSVEHRRRPRLPEAAVLHWEEHADGAEEAALREYDRTMAASGLYERRQVPVPGRPGEMQDYGWLEHSARRVSRPTRIELSQVLREQGFELR